MKILFIILAILFAIVLVLMIIPIRLEILYEKNSVTNELSVTCKYMFFKFKIDPKKHKKTNEKADEEDKDDDKPPESRSISFAKQKERIERYADLFEELKSDIARILIYLTERALVFDNISVNIEFGFDDAMYTGIFTGILNGLVYNVLGTVHNYATLRGMNVNIQPVFGKTVFNSRFECILRLKNVHIIIIVLNVLRMIRKINKTKGSKSEAE